MAGAEGPSESPPTLLQHTLASEPLFSRMVQAGAASTHLPACSQGPHHCLLPGKLFSMVLHSRRTHLGRSQQPTASTKPPEWHTYPVPLAPSLALESHVLRQ